MSYCNPRALSGVTTTASMVASTMLKEGGDSDNGGLSAVPEVFCGPIRG